MTAAEEAQLSHVERLLVEARRDIQNGKTGKATAKISVALGRCSMVRDANDLAS